MAPSVNTVVVDNGSSDDTLSVAREQTGWTVLANRENRGFAAAVNQGVRATDAEFVLLVNPDVRLLTSVDELIRATHEFGLAGGKLVDQKNRPQKGFTIRRFPTAASLVLELLGVNRLWPRNPVNRSYRYLDRSLEQPGPVDQPAGAFLMFRRDVWQHLDGFDEQFFPIWFEDVDFCRRAAAAGYKIEYVPSVVAEHRGGHSVSLLSPGCRAIFWCDSLLKYAAKHFRFLAYRAVCLAVVLTSVPRMVAGMILEQSFLPIVSYLKIARMGLRRLVSVRAATPASQDS